MSSPTKHLEYGDLNTERLDSKSVTYFFKSMGYLLTYVPVVE